MDEVTGHQIPCTEHVLTMTSPKQGTLVLRCTLPVGHDGLHTFVYDPSRHGPLPLGWAGQRPSL